MVHTFFAIVRNTSYQRITYFELIYIWSNSIHTHVCTHADLLLPHNRFYLLVTWPTQRIFMNHFPREAYNLRGDTYLQLSNISLWYQWKACFWFYCVSFSGFILMHPLMKISVIKWEVSCWCNVLYHQVDFNYNDMQSKKLRDEIKCVLYDEWIIQYYHVANHKCCANFAEWRRRLNWICQFFDIL